jgi:hypothetical protein
VTSGRVTKDGVTLRTEVLTGVFTAADIYKRYLAILREDE